jgi:L-glutamine-phosphate cytidylyltransferase
MKAIIIGAGRGRRLMPLTEDDPKSFAPIAGRRILDWDLQSLRGGGLSDIVFIGGWQIDKIRREYPSLTFVHNERWERNNILASLMYARDHMSGGFVCSYADILYRASVVERLLKNPGDIVLAVDTDWRTRYQHRTAHPEDDAEKVRVDGERVLQVSRRIPSQEAHGEYIGVAKFSAAGAALLCRHFDEVSNKFDGQPFQGAASVEKAYLIHLFQHMIEAGVTFSKVDTHGDYMEIDTTEDYELANRLWSQAP